jgi:hypothetical protein
MNFHFGGQFFGCPGQGEEFAAIFPGANSESNVSPHHISAHSDDGIFGHYTFKNEGTVFRMCGSGACNGSGASHYRGKGTLAGNTFSAQFKLQVDGGTDVVSFTFNRVAS